MACALLGFSRWQYEGKIKNISNRIGNIEKHSGKPNFAIVTCLCNDGYDGKVISMGGKGGKRRKNNDPKTHDIIHYVLYGHRRFL